MEANNMAAMREALELAIEGCPSQTDDPLECCEFSCVYQVEPHGEAGADCPWKKIRAALALPLRNCDVGTAEEQYKRYSAFTSKWTPCSFNGNARCAGDCPVNKILERDGSGDLQCPFVWAQMPYESNEKGNQL